MRQFRNARYGAYFACIATDFSPRLTYVIPALIALIVVSLDNIQAHLIGTTHSIRVAKMTSCSRPRSLWIDCMSVAATLRQSERPANFFNFSRAAPDG